MQVTKEGDFLTTFWPDNNRFLYKPSKHSPQQPLRFRRKWHPNCNPFKKPTHLELIIFLFNDFWIWEHKKVNTTNNRSKQTRVTLMIYKKYGDLCDSKNIRHTIYKKLISLHVMWRIVNNNNLYFCFSYCFIRCMLEF